MLTQGPDVFPIHLHCLPPGLRTTPLRGMMLCAEWREDALRYTYSIKRVRWQWEYTVHERLERFMRQWELLCPRSWPRCPVYFSVEGATWLGPPEYLPHLVAAGLRAIQVYHPHVESAYISSFTGLTAEGKDLLRRMAEYNLWLDLSHLHGSLLRHVLEYAPCRRIVSHMVCGDILMPSITARANAMSDADIDICNADLYGVAFLDDLISLHSGTCPQQRLTNIPLVAAHIVRLTKIVGTQRTALGPDYFSPRAMRTAQARVVPTLDKSKGLILLNAALQALGLTPHAVNSIFYANAERVLAGGVY